MTTITYPRLAFSSVHTSMLSSDKERYVFDVIDELCCRLGVERVGAEHKAALTTLSELVSNVVVDNVPVKGICELPTGTGKSTFITVAIAVAQRHGYDFPVCICLENLDELNATYTGLTKSGVASDEIACTFNPASTKGRTLAITPTDKCQWANRRVLLCCHAVVDSTREDWSDRIMSNWGQRFVFYDETLKLGKVYPFDLAHLIEQFDELQTYFSVSLRDWLSETINRLESCGASVKVPACPVSAKAAVDKAKRAWRRSKGRKPDFPAIDAIVSEGIETIHKRREGCVAFIRKLPPLESALVLDASHTASPYTRWLTSIKPIALSPFKHYKHVTTIATGRGGSKLAMDGRIHEEREHLATLLKTLRLHGKSALVVCAQCYEDDVRSAGATNVLTYGKHRGTNAFKDFDTVILFGLFYPSPSIAAGNVMMYGGKPDAEDLMSIGWQQALVDAYQAANRTTMRNCFVDDNGITQANAQTIYLFANLNKTQQEFWQGMLPDSTYMTEEISVQVRRVLEYLRKSVKTKEKKADIRTATGLTKRSDGIPDRQWREIASLVVKSSEWIDEGGVWLMKPLATPTFSYK
jgi:hypothetical protein